MSKGVKEKKKILIIKMSFQIRPSTMPIEVSNAKFAETAGVPTNSTTTTTSSAPAILVTIPDETATLHANTIATLTGSTSTRTLSLDSSSAQSGQIIFIKSMTTSPINLTINSNDEAKIDQGNGTVGDELNLPFPTGAGLTFMYTASGWLVSSSTG